MNLRKVFYFNILVLLLAFSTVTCQDSNGNDPVENNAITVVDYLGPLKVNGSQIVDKDGNPAALRGMSLFWSQWGGKYYNADCIKWLVEEWKCTVIRASLGINGTNDGYIANPQQELAKIGKVIDACIDLGIYVIVDWHDHNAQDHLEEAKGMFKIIAEKYGDKPNLIYEIFNEPLQVSWKDVIKPYAEEVIKVIREYDPDNLIVAGTRTWSQDVNLVVSDPIIDNNTAYSLHFYTSTHPRSLRDRAIATMNAGIPIFVTEFGFSEASGNGVIDPAGKTMWTNFLNDYNLSWCNWSIIDKNETSAALLPGASQLGGWDDSMISESGKIVREYIQTMNTPLWEKIDELNNK